MTDTNAVLGYATPLIVSPGEEIAFRLSSAVLGRAEARIVRVRCADPDPAGPGIRVAAPGSAIDGTVPLRHQPIHPGSFGIVADPQGLDGLASLSVGVFLWPTTPGSGEQTILSRWSGAAGWRFGLDGQGRLCFEVADGARRWIVTASRPLLEREWVFVGAVLDGASATLTLIQRSLDPQAGRDRSETITASGPARLPDTPSAPLLLAATSTGRDSPPTDRHLDGKLDRPRLHAVALDEAPLRALVEAVVPAPGDPDLLAAWDFSRGIPTDVAEDVGPRRQHATLHQLPARAMTGANWDGRTQSWREAPWLYGAIHFHADDMADCGWTPDLTLTIPTVWRSGYYSLELTAEHRGERVESHVPFFIRPARDGHREPLAVVASTATYLAYANSALRLDQVHAEAMLEGLIVLSRDDVYLQAHRELGLSTYDTHADGSGWCTSTAARPILNMRPRGNVFNYGADSLLLDWLETEGIGFDVVTDEDIHRQGLSALAPYRCVITASHPEYVSKEMLDAFDAYQRGGGRHMYLGGNGFYWRIAFHPTRPHTIEIRRGAVGLRTWEGEPGEGCLAFTGEPSGLWRANGRAPQRLVGVGFDAQVFDRSGWYHRLPDSFDPRVAFIFEGVGAEERIGDFGLRGGGAAGIEVDRADATLGSPPALMLLATCDRLGYGGIPAPEELRTLHRGFTGDQNARVRADMTFFPTAKGGAVFTTGSIAWVSALPHNGGANNVARITGNVLRRFLDPAPFKGFEDRA
ncbi:N,N-dimethylformamidase beta subunit family domain-containing protein [Elioraea tepidiphila]|uniref:N,N-dimethylformamidase beta subunit family domain-containing protein n=1 Tax=Elioraea tepidiphila TaxID=457934 RepID=UPI0003802A27|nr:N,N-dimethylformamidase beta subunit family domain-containing protein [Elioraea tepidiphila]